MANLPFEQMPFDDFGYNFGNVSLFRHADLPSRELSVTYRIGPFWFLVNKYSDRVGEVGIRTGIH